MGWGNNAYGQMQAPAGAANVAGIAAGNFHSLALQSDGRPIFTVQPVSQSVIGGSTVRLQPMVAGVQPLSYQWQRSGTNLPGATSSALILANLQYTDAGPYTLVAANALGTATSAPAGVSLQSLPGPILSLRAPPGAPPSISFPSQPGSNYLLEYKNRLFDPSWTPLFPPVTATGSVMVLQDTNPPGPSRYYRLRSE